MTTAQRTALIAAAILLLGAAGLVLGLRPSTAQGPILKTADAAWTMYQRVPSHNAVIAAAGFHANWQAPLGGRINGGFALIDGTLYAVSFDKKLYALDASTGKVRWSSAAAGNILMSTPVIAQGLVIVGSGHNGFLKPNDASSQTWGRPEGDDVLAFSAADGRQVWAFHTVGEDMPSPVIAGSMVVLANGDGHAYGLDLATGSLRWQVALPGVATMSSATLANGAVYVSTCHNAPYYCETRALDPQNGRTLWTNPNGGNDCSPAVGGGKVFVNSNRDDTIRYHTGGYDVVAALNQRTGKTVWTYKAEPGPYTFVSSNERQIAGTYADGVLYQPIGNAGRVVALDARTGKVRWNLRTWANVKMSPVVVGSRVYFGDTGGILYNVDARTGRIVHTTSFLQPFSPAPPLVVGGTIFVADGSVIVAMSLKDV